ncbi:hypothetical protein F5X68DRAFT_28281 [Plectosphaerella plurivora]|uniref:Uncharacterized protein n=1 Tax=Plectosphaerella plurivora TaxID=936078 RepID=A0A9P9AF93_9PEZI|nr:hypothetical protein F5X68DRAFT_28281 [Plectosphaerella plurivora]
MAPKNGEKLPQEELKAPTRNVYLHNHTLFGTTINATDLTSHLAKTYSDPDFVAEALQVAFAQCTPEKGEAALTPTWTIRRGDFFSRAMDVVETATGASLARWTLALLSTSASELTFSSDSPHSSHPITVRPVGSSSMLQERFVVDSAELAWKIERGANPFDVRYKLVRTAAGHAHVVARYAHPPGSMYRGGILSVDENEVDVVVALVTCCVMIKKRVQKDVETLGVAS